jgi:DNA-binding NarL/FixJ family response regulator
MLTPREDEVVKLIAEGHSSEEIAVALTISPKTVERHRANIQQKLEHAGPHRVGADANAGRAVADQRGTCAA